MQKTVRAESTADNRAITRYRMMSAPRGKAADLASGLFSLLNDPSRRHRKGSGVRQGSAKLLFRPRGGISFVPAPESIHILDIFCASVPQALVPGPPPASFAQNLRPVHLVLGQHPGLG